MDCSTAKNYILKYMDDKMTFCELKKLEEHILICSQCKEEFFICRDFTKNDFFITVGNPKIGIKSKIPNNFENNVMLKIKNISEKIEYTLWYTWGLTCLICGIFFMIISYKQNIMEFMSSYNISKNIIKNLEHGILLVENMGFMANKIFMDFLIKVNNIRHYFVIILLSIFVIRLLVVSKNKKEFI